MLKIQHGFQHVIGNIKKLNCYAVFSKCLFDQQRTSGRRSIGAAIKQSDRFHRVVQ